MGQFSGKFLSAVKRAAQAMRGTLYQTYFEFDYDQVLGLPEAVQRTARWWFRAPRPKLDGLAQLCCARAGVTYSGWHPVTNGMIVEQQQILTTQNLAALVHGLGLADALQPYLPHMARRCFDWICRRQQINDKASHARLIMIKNTAYAWRQMLFHLSLVTKDELVQFLAWAEGHLALQNPGFQNRSRPALNGLVAAAEGRPPSGSEGCRPLLGWSEARHWLLD